MPMFEYICQQCEHKHESYSSKEPGAATRPCPKCGHTSDQVLVSVPAKRRGEYGIQR